jgi:phage I-like protein
VRPVVTEVTRRVATFDAPQSWLAFPEHLVVHVVAATEGRLLPHEQESARQLKSEIDRI